MPLRRSTVADINMEIPDKEDYYLGTWSASALKSNSLSGNLVDSCRISKLIGNFLFTMIHGPWIMSIIIYFNFP